MIQKLPLKNCKLWWPAWQQGIPFDAYGFTGAIEGEGYRFNVDSDMDSWLCPDGSLMPIATAKLMTSKGEVKFSSFGILTDGRVQVNLLVDGLCGYHVEYHNLEDLYFLGDTYIDD